MYNQERTPQKNSQSFLLMIIEDSIVPLANNENRQRFGIRFAKLKIFGAGTPIDAVDETSGLMDSMSLGAGGTSGSTSNMLMGSAANSTMVETPKTAASTVLTATVTAAPTAKAPAVTATTTTILSDGGGSS